MFQSIQPDEIFDLRKAQASEAHPSYWLAQLHKVDWHEMLKIVDVKMSMKTRKQIMAEEALKHFEFTTCDGHGEVWQLWTELRKEHRTLVIQFRHPESNWTCGTPELVDLEKNEPLGVVNIAGRLFCKVK